MNMTRSADGSLTLPASLINTLPRSEVSNVTVDDNKISLVPENTSEHKSHGLKKWLGAGTWAGRFKSEEDIVKHIRKMRDEDD